MAMGAERHKDQDAVTAGQANQDKEDRERR